MKKMNFTIKAILLCFVATITLTSCNRDDENVAGGTASIVGTWTCVSNYCTAYKTQDDVIDNMKGLIITFKEDGSYSSGSWYDDTYGTWAIIDNQLYLNPHYQVRRIYDIQCLTNSKLIIHREWQGSSSSQYEDYEFKR